MHPHGARKLRRCANGSPNTPERPAQRSQGRHRGRDRHAARGDERLSVRAISSAEIMARAGGRHVRRAEFRFADGESMKNLRLHYVTLGKPHRNAAGHVDNAVLVLHGTGGDTNQFLREQFAGVLFVPDGLLDASTYFIVITDGIGHGKSSKPSDGLHAKFPHYGYRDMVRAQHDVLVDGAARRSPAPRDGDVDGRDADVAVGRDVSRDDGRADAARELADPDQRPQPRLARHDRRRPAQRPRLRGRRVHGAAAGPQSGRRHAVDLRLRAALRPVAAPDARCQPTRTTRTP